MKGGYATWYYVLFYARETRFANHKYVLFIKGTNFSLNIKLKLNTKNKEIFLDILYATVYLVCS